MEFNFNHTLFFALQRLDSPGMRLKPEQVASISASLHFSCLQRQRRLYMATDRIWIHVQRVSGD